MITLVKGRDQPHLRDTAIYIVVTGFSWQISVRQRSDYISGASIETWRGRHISQGGEAEQAALRFPDFSPRFRAREQ
jgi:hypothetical protein